MDHISGNIEATETYNISFSNSLKSQLDIQCIKFALNLNVFQLYGSLFFSLSNFKSQSLSKKKHILENITPKAKLHKFDQNVLFIELELKYISVAQILLEICLKNRN